MNHIKMVEYIQYGDTWKVAREKINGIMGEVEAHIPSIWENWNWYLWPTDTWIPAVWARLREWNNLLFRDSNLELYCDLQLADWITPIDNFPVWITVWNISRQNGWEVSWILMNAKTSSWQYIRWIYANNWKLLFDNWLWELKQIPTTEDVLNAVNTLRNELHTIAFSWKSSDLNNDYWLTATPLMTEEQRGEIPWRFGDDKEYMLYEVVEN